MGKLAFFQHFLVSLRSLAPKNKLTTLPDPKRHAQSVKNDLKMVIIGCQKGEIMQQKSGNHKSPAIDLKLFRASFSYPKERFKNRAIYFRRHRCNMKEPTIHAVHAIHAKHLFRPFLGHFLTIMNYFRYSGVPGALYLCVTSLVRICSQNLVS